MYYREFCPETGAGAVIENPAPAPGGQKRPAPAPHPWLDLPGIFQKFRELFQIFQNLVS